MSKDLRSALYKHIPHGAIGLVEEWIQPYSVILRISRSRLSKTGDFRPPLKKGPYRISVNHDLAPQAFLVTLVHEIAHMIVWGRHGRRAKPHGKEWKDQFKGMMGDLLDNKVFEIEVEAAIRKHLQKTRATSANDLALSRLIQSPGQNGQVFLEDLPTGSEFRIRNGRTFIKKEKLRKRYRCIENDTRKAYLFNGAAKVTPIKNS